MPVEYILRGNKSVGCRGRTAAWARGVQRLADGGPLMRRINVLIADGYPVVEQGLRKVLGAQRDFRIVACCSDGTSCVEAIRDFRPDLAIIDISMPGLTGLEILSIVNSEGYPTR